MRHNAKSSDWFSLAPIVKYGYNYGFGSMEEFFYGAPFFVRNYFSGFEYSFVLNIAFAVNK